MIVQIVDGRNPITFRCEDLETYVSEVGIGMGNKEKRGVRKSLLLINKSDLLTKKQRFVLSVPGFWLTVSSWLICHGGSGA